MAEHRLGNINSSRGDSYQVKWFDIEGDVFVKRNSGSPTSWKRCGKSAHSERDALNIAKEFLRHNN